MAGTGGTVAEGAEVTPSSVLGLARLAGFGTGRAWGSEADLPLFIEAAEAEARADPRAMALARDAASVRLVRGVPSPRAWREAARDAEPDGSALAAAQAAYGRLCALRAPWPLVPMPGGDDDPEPYALGLMVEECGEWMAAGPGNGSSASEAGDVLAAIAYALARGIAPRAMPPTAITRGIESEVHASRGWMTPHAVARLVEVVGRAMRFGIDTPSTTGPGAETARLAVWSRMLVARACLEAAMPQATTDGTAMRSSRDRKLAKLLDPASVDNLGRRLAP